MNQEKLMIYYDQVEINELKQLYMKGLKGFMEYRTEFKKMILPY